MRAYQPYTEFQFNLWSFLLIAWALVGGIMYGLLLALVAMFIYLPIVFPLVLGGIAGKLLADYIKKRGLPNPTFALSCALLMGLTIYGTSQFFDYQSFKREMRGALEERFGEIEQTDFEEFTDYFLIENTGSPGYWGYLKLQAQEGIGIGRVARSSTFTLRGPGFWLYLLLDVGLLIGAAMVVVKLQTDNSFCPTCRSWYAAESIGYVTGALADSFMALLQQGSYKRAGTLITVDSTPRPYLRLAMSHCGCERGDSILKVTQVTGTTNGNESSKELTKGIISAQEENELLDATTEWEET
ncbi:MAG: hypothetical protein H0T73_03345 [Ardenticatenales bacterium]|nr:hypothetical protein [Ardenticatenales bacterium]